jgi:hypothetical protein
MRRVFGPRVGLQGLQIKFYCYAILLRVVVLHAQGGLVGLARLLLFLGNNRLWRPAFKMIFEPSIIKLNHSYGIGNFGQLVRGICSFF